MSLRKHAQLVLHKAEPLYSWPEKVIVLSCHYNYCASVLLTDNPHQHEHTMIKSLLLRAFVCVGGRWEKVVGGESGEMIRTTFYWQGNILHCANVIFQSIVLNLVSQSISMGGGYG